MIKTHTLFRDVHESILKLNHFIKDDGYYFEKINLAQLELLTAPLLRINYTEIEYIQLQDGTVVSNNFYRAYNRSNISNDLMLNDETLYYIILTKDELINGNENENNIMAKSDEVRKYSLNLLKKLHLLKNSSIEYITTIQYDYEKKNWKSGIDFGDIRRFFILRLKIEDSELEFSETLIKNDLFDDSSFQLSIDFFQLAYRTDNMQLCYLNLMTSLESIFNNSTNPIAHTVARHLALILVDNKEDFLLKYKEIKKMYDLRSAIVHGASKQDYKKVSGNFDILTLYTLKALQFVNEKKLDKKQLFDFLNSYGFS